MIAQFFFWFVSNKQRVNVSLSLIFFSLIGVLILGGMQTVWSFSVAPFVLYIVGAPLLIACSVLVFLGGPLLHERSEREVWETKKTRLYVAGFLLNIIAAFLIVSFVVHSLLSYEPSSALIPAQSIAAVFLSVIYTVLATKIVQFRPPIHL